MDTETNGFNKITETKDDVYRDLQRSLDKQPISFPETESGVEIRILKYLFAPEKALIASKLDSTPKTLNAILGELENDNIPLERLEKALDEMWDDGLISRSMKKKKEENIKAYVSNPMVLGFYEFQLNNLTEDFIRDIDQYLEEAFMEELNKTKIPQLRAIPIEQAVGIERNIATYDDIRAIIENSGDPIVVNKCICRKKNDILGNSCKTTDLRETCFSFRTFALTYQHLGLGRTISKEEALEILEEAENAGLVLQPGNSIRPMGLCCCCGCCCQIIENQKKFDSPAQFFATNYSAQVDSNRCKGCGTCKTRCPMDAIEIVEEKSKKDLTRCIGCGACVPTCPQKAIKLIEKETKTIPPKSTFETYKSIAQERARLEELESD